MMLRAAATLVAAACSTTAAAEGEFSSVLRVIPETRELRPDGPLRAAAALTDFGRDRLRTEVEVRGKVQALSYAGTLRTTALEGREPRHEGILNELYVDAPLFGQSFTVGKKIAGWGVGFGFRPLDVVQQQDRRQLYQYTLEGIPAIAWEHFTETSAWTVLYANPANGRAREIRDDESVAVRWFRQSGSTDLRGVARFTERQGVQAGAGVNHVVNDAIQWYGSVLAIQRHERWLNRLATSGGGLLPATYPLHEASYGRAWQAAIGGTWTGTSGFGVMLEAWYDGTAYTREQWQALAQLAARQDALLGVPGIPESAVRGNLAWSLRYFERPNLVRENVLLRFSYDGEHWDAALDALYTPVDGGSVLTATLTRQFDRVRWDLGARRYGGPGDSAYGLLPDRTVAYLAAQVFF